MRNLITLAFLGLVLIGCSASAPGPVTVTEIECRLNSDCDTGSYCDPFANLCGWDCRDDSECELGMFCDAINGQCLREEPLPPPPDMSAVLEITPGPTEDLAVLSGTADVELVRFKLTNRSDRPIEIRELPTGFYAVSSFPLTGILWNVRLRNERERRVVMGPVDLRGVPGEATYTFPDAFAVAPGEEMILALRIDLQGGYGYTAFDLVIGAPSGALLSELRYLDTGEAVSMDRVMNNLSVVRHINVLPEELTSPPTDVGTVSVSMPESGTIAFIDASPTLEPVVAHIDLLNGLDRQVSFSNLRVRVSRSDGSPWSPDGWSPLRAMDVMDGHGAWLSVVPGASFCDVDGCTNTFEGVTLEAGESMRLFLTAAISDPGRNLHFAVGNTVMFEHITYMPGADVPVERIDGNFEGSFALISR